MFRLPNVDSLEQGRKIIVGGKILLDVAWNL
jgi:hypothetical protein